MNLFRSTAAALAAVGLLAGCASQSQPSLVPVSGSNQTQSPAGLTPGHRHTDRILYIADIDGQPGLGQIHVYPASMKNPQQIRLISNGAGRPFGMFVDAKNILYVANEPNKLQGSVTEFKPGASSPFFTITNLKGIAEGVAADASGNVYVNESVQDEGYVQVFPPGKNTPSKTIDTGVGGYAFTPGDMAFDPKGNLLIAEQAKFQLNIVSLPPGASQVVPVNIDLTNIAGPGMGVDKAGNIYAASSISATISVFAPGQREPSRTIAGVSAYGLTWVTPEGAVYQASGEGSVAEIAPGASSPTNVINCACSAQGVAVTH
jgi:sugar lactone lactonase YvrE